MADKTANKDLRKLVFPFWLYILGFFVYTCGQFFAGAIFYWSTKSYLHNNMFIYVFALIGILILAKIIAIKLKIKEFNIIKIYSFQVFLLTIIFYISISFIIYFLK